MTIKVNKELCIGCGACAAVSSDVFEIDSEGKANVISQSNEESAKNAKETGPVQAISVE